MSRIEGGKVERPGCASGGAKEGRIEGVEDICFGLVRAMLDAFILQNLDGVLSKAV